MALSAEQVRRVAALARLHLSDDEVARYAAQLSAILDAMAQLETVDTTGVEPTWQTHDLFAPWREDEVHAPLGAERAVASAPEKAGTCFRVPKVIEQP